VGSVPKVLWARGITKKTLDMYSKIWYDAKVDVVSAVEKEYHRAGQPIPFAKFHIKEQRSPLYTERDGKFYRPDGSRIRFRRFPVGKTTIYWFDDDEMLLPWEELQAMMHGRKPIYRNKDPNDTVIGFYKYKFSATSSTATPNLEAA
jgi:hypothetical protein